MNRISISVLLFIILSFSGFSFAQGQALANVLSYCLDTLKGFDLNTTYQEAIREHLSADEIRQYLYIQEEEFVARKYKIPSKLKRFGLENFVLTSGCNNMGFETGNFTGWTGYVGENNNSDSTLTLVTNGIASLGINSIDTSCSMFTLVNSAAGNDYYGAFPMLDPLPGGGLWSLRLGGEHVNLRSPCTGGGTGGAPGEVIQQTVSVTSSNALFSFDYAVVLLDAPHGPHQYPYFRAEILDQNGTPIPGLRLQVESIFTGVPAGMAASSKLWPRSGNSTNKDSVFYSNWKTNTWNLTSYIGTTVTTRFTAAGCVAGGHWGYAYIDGSCSSVSFQSTPEVCKGGSVRLTAPAVSPSGSYLWQTVPTGTVGIVGSTTSQSVTIDSSGTYQVTVTESPGYSYTMDTTIIFYPYLNPSVSLVSTNPSCGICTNGSITATVTGGTTPYFYSWSPAPAAGQGTATVSGLGIGQYTLTVTESNPCSVSSTAMLSLATGIASGSGQYHFSVYPNPANDFMIVEIVTTRPTSCLFKVCNILGQQMSSFERVVDGSFKQNMDLAFFSEGVYFISCETREGKTVQKVIVKR
jgi:hypothetical protein